ncbi:MULTISPECIES: DNA topoisomerase (ATP-hydrolyzing) subunit B [Holospora]|uniref:DNA gyrase subunit B n=2 Tax=Holospora TaxID=44747 RepID=A0A061JGB1_9PROT|nr:MULTISPECIES: DNA topoisomerase (ATP-hydrolyzing) subunit B [Holospora]ETZ04960.1 DNA gyrase subunit B [Holospora undulata HU1]GAJ46487.1 DNA gyrase subunit B [Holospora elegans E1]
MSNSSTYSSENIEVLKGLDAVRKRPGMYIGDTDDGSGLHHMIWEVVDNAIDESLAGYCNEISVVLESDGSASITDNGRGIPVDIHAEEGISGAELIMTRLHAGGKFNQNAYKVSGGLHGVGISAVNALSEWLDLTVWRDGGMYYLRFCKGVPQGSLERIESSDRKGTLIRFMPCKEIFKITQFDVGVLEKRLQELAFLNPTLTLSLKDSRDSNEKSWMFAHSGGLKAYVAHLNRNKEVLQSSPIHIFLQKEDMVVEAALEWTETYYENNLCFTNNIPQREGGTHLAGFRSALTRVFNHGGAFYKKEKVTFTGEDIREGLTSVLSVKIPDPRFGSQTKDKLVSSEIRPLVESAITEGLTQWLEENVQDAKRIYARITNAAFAREAARKARDLTRKKSTLDIASLPGKLSDCSEKDPEKRELCLLEGESAGGTARNARDRKTQAVLPLRGKILNVERVRFDRMLASSEIGTLIVALGAGIGAEFDLDKLRYHKIILMTDADVDGSHIRTLLLTFFFRHMRSLIERGHLFIAQPPLYGIRKGSSKIYLKNERALEEFLMDTGMRGVVLENSLTSKAGADLKSFLALCIKAKELIYSLQVSAPIIVEQLFLAGLLDQVPSSEELPSWIEHALHRLQRLGDWKWKINQDSENSREGVQIHYEKDGVIFRYEFSYKLYDQKEFKKLFSYRQPLLEMFQEVCTLRQKEDRVLIYGPCSLWDQINKYGRKGLEIKRYKGLGEMEDYELWETTLDPSARTLLQVRIEDAQIADELFSTLMGDAVPPRRAFIQKNAMNALIDA